MTIDHVELLVPDRHEAADWYGRVLGLEVLSEFEFWSEDPRGPLMLSPDGGRTKIALFTGASRLPGPDRGLRRIAFGVDGAGFLGLLDRLESLDLRDGRGAPVRRGAQVDHDLAFSLYFDDPWGNHLEVTTYDHEAVRGG